MTPSVHLLAALISGSGTVELVYDPDATGQAAFIEDVLTADDTADATFELFTTGTTSGSDGVSFAGIITSMDIAPLLVIWSLLPATSSPAALSPPTLNKG